MIISWWIHAGLHICIHEHIRIMQLGCVGLLVFSSRWCELVSCTCRGGLWPSNQTLQALSGLRHSPQHPESNAASSVGAAAFTTTPRGPTPAAAHFTSGCVSLDHAGSLLRRRSGQLGCNCLAGTTPDVLQLLLVVDTGVDPMLLR